MSVVRNRPNGARSASFGLGLCVFALIPTEVGYQDIASLLPRQPGVAQRWQKRVFSSALSSIKVATFSFGPPIGTSSRPSTTFQLATPDNHGIDITGTVTRHALPRDAFSFNTAALFFGSSSLGASMVRMERWQPSEEPVIVTFGPDSEMKAIASLPARTDDAGKAGESVASKGEVNSDDQRVKTPAERLGLFDQKS